MEAVKRGETPGERCPDLRLQAEPRRGSYRLSGRLDYTRRAEYGCRLGQEKRDGARERKDMTAQQAPWQNKEKAHGYSRWSNLGSRLRYVTLARKIVDSVGILAAGSIIVDLGTGPGMLAVELHKLCPQAKIIGVDPSNAMLKIAGENAAKAGISNYEVRLGRAEEIPLEAESADLVVSQSSFHEWADQQKGLSEIFRVLKPGGRVVLKDYNRAWLSGWKRSFLGLFGHMHMFRFTIGDVADLLRDAGFAGIKGDGSEMQWSVQAAKPQESRG